MATAAGARSAFRSASAYASARSAAARFAANAKPKAAPCPFRIGTQKPISHRIFRSPVEMSCVSVESFIPLHTATASALLTSMLSVAPRSRGWSLEGQDRTKRRT